MNNLISIDVALSNAWFLSLSNKLLLLHGSMGTSHFTELSVGKEEHKNEETTLSNINSNVLKAVKLYDQDKYDEAMIILNEELKNESLDAKSKAIALDYRAGIFFLTKDYESAYHDYSNLIDNKLDPQYDIANVEARIICCKYTKRYYQMHLDYEYLLNNKTWNENFGRKRAEYVRASSNALASLDQNNNCICL